MSSVRETRTRIKASDPSTWPEWTDESTYGPTDPAEWPAWTDEVRPELPPLPIPDADEDDAFYRSLNRVGHSGDCPDPAVCLPAADWVEGRAAWHRLKHEEHDPHGAHMLIAFRLDALASWLKGQGAAGVLASAPARVELPCVWDYPTPLAREVATEAALLYPYVSAVKRLAARALFRLAGEVEFLQSTSAESFLIDSEAAWAAALDAVYAGVGI